MRAESEVNIRSLRERFGIKVIGDRQELHGPAFDNNSLLSELMKSLCLEIRKNRSKRDHIRPPFAGGLAEGNKNIEVFGDCWLDIVVGRNSASERVSVNDAIGFHGIENIDGPPHSHFGRCP